MPLFSVTFQDANGNKQTGLSVELWEGNGDITKYADMNDADGDGVYTCDVTIADTYTVKVGGVKIDELTSIFIPASDIRTHLDASNPHSASASDTDLDAVKGTGWTSETVKDNADDITTIKGTGWTSETIKANADAIVAIKGTGWTATMTLKKHEDNIGDLDFETTNYLESITNITNSLIELDKQIKNLDVQGATDLYSTRCLASGRQVAGSAAGAEASNPIQFQETAFSYKKKVKIGYVRGNDDKYIRARVLTDGGTGNLRLGLYTYADALQESYVVPIQAGLDPKELEILVTALQPLDCYICLELQADSGTVYIKNWEIYITSY